MGRFFRFLLSGMNQCLTPRNKIFLTIVSVLSLLSIFRGINDFKAVYSESKKFHNAETIRLENQLNYMSYSKEGIRVFVLPAATDIFFPGSTFVSHLTARIDSLATVELQSNCKGKEIFKKDNDVRLRFSVIVLLFGSLGTLFLLYDAMNKKEYLKSLVSQWNFKIIYLGIILSRYLFLILYYTLLTICMIGTVIAQQIKLTSSDLLILANHYFLTLFILLFFVFIGSILGSRIDGNGHGPILITWIITLIIIPVVINWFLEKSPQDLISPYQLYAQKMNKVNNWEKKIAKEKGTFKTNSLEVSKKIINNYQQKILPQLEHQEWQYKQLLAKGIRSANRIALLNPITFYNLSCTEFSSRGYENYLLLYDSLIHMNRNFFLFWVKQVYYQNTQRIVSFIKSEENLFYSQAKLPAEFNFGLLITSTYLLIIGIASYFQYKSSLIQLGKEIGTEDIIHLSSIDKDLKLGMVKVWIVRGTGLRNLLFCLFGGSSKRITKSGFSGKIRLNGTNIAILPFNTNRFLYLCQKKEIPTEIKVKNLIFMLSSMNQLHYTHQYSAIKKSGIENILDESVLHLSTNNYCKLILAILELDNSQILLLDDIAVNLPYKDTHAIKNKLVQRADAGSLIIYLTRDEMDTGCEKIEKPCYDDGEDWLLRVEANHRLQENKKNQKTTKKT